MMYIPCEVCTTLIFSYAEVEISQTFTKKIIGESHILCNNCRHDSNVIKYLIKKEVLLG